VPVSCAFDETHLRNISGDQHAYPLYLTIRIIRKDICHTPTNCSWILVGLIACSLKGAKNIDEAWHSAVGTVLSQLRHLDMADPSVKWDCADGFQRQCDLLLTAWVGDYPEHVRVAKVLYGSCPLCKVPKGAPMGHCTFRPLDNSRVQHIHPELVLATVPDRLFGSGS